MYVLALLFFALVSFPRHALAAKPVFDSLKRASDNAAAGNAGASFDNSLAAEPLAVTASTPTAKAYDYGLPPARRRPLPPKEAYEAHKQEDNPAWVVQNGAQMLSSSSGVFSSAWILPAMVGPIGWALGGIFCVAAGAIAIQTGVETYKVVKNAWF